MRRQMTFNISEEDNLDGAITAFIREWIILAASEIPREERTLTVLAERAGKSRQTMARWLYALEIRTEVEEM